MSQKLRPLPLLPEPRQQADLAPTFPHVPSILAAVKSAACLILDRPSVLSATAPNPAPYTMGGRSDMRWWLEISPRDWPLEIDLSLGLRTRMRINFYDCCRFQRERETPRMEERLATRGAKKGWWDCQVWYRDLTSGQQAQDATSAASRDKRRP